MFDDEGYELAKALLMTHQRLYAPVWWDQPPGHPALLQAGAALFGNGVQSFRLVAGLLGASSLWALAACASAGRRREAGNRALLTPSLPVNSSEKTQRLGADKEGNSESLSASNLWVLRCGLSGCIASLAAILLCLSSMGFLSYGMSVTIMLPALGFALWAVWLWQRFGLGGNRWWLFGSGIVFGLGFQTKFTVLLFLPALAVEFIRHAWRIGDRGWEMGDGESQNGEFEKGGPSPRPSPLAAQRARESESRRRGDESLTNAGEGQRLLTSSPTETMGAREKVTRALGFLGQWSGIWLAGFGYGVALVWAFFPEEDLVWLLQYHFRPEVTAAFQGSVGLSPMLHKLGLDWPIAGFAVLGLFLGLVQRRWAVVFPTVFFATSFLAHAWHRPWWDYYYLHLSIPMAWLGGLGVQWTWDSLMRNAECGMRNDPSPRPSPLAVQRAREENQREAESAPVAALCERRPADAKDEPDGGHRPPLQGWRLLEFWPGWKPAGLIAAFSFCLAGFLVEMPERYERETAFLRAKPSPTEVKVLAELKERRADTRWLYTDRPIWCAHANILIPPELAVLSLKRIASGDITHAEFLRLLHHYRPEQILLQRRHFEDEKFHEFLNAFYDVVIEEGNLKYLVRRDWEAARKQKRASSSRREEAPSNAEGRLRNAESSERLLTSSPTGASPSPRPSPPVGAREKRAVEWVPAAAVSLPSERRLEAAGTWSFAFIRVFRGHLGGQAG